MTLYKIQLKLHSPIVTLLKGDTIWGHYAWGIANHEGDDKVTEFLTECKSNNPPLIVSSAFPRNTLCKPIPPVKEHKDLSAEDYAKIKKLKKQKFENADMFIINGGSQSDRETPFKQNAVTHNSINRLTGVVEEGLLYSVSEMWARSDEFDMYVLSSYDSKRVKQLTDWAFENGYGADASVGKGYIEVESIIEITPKHLGSHKYMALAPFIADDNVSDLRADTFVRSGKIGGAFASSMSPYKKTVIYYDEGAVFTSSKPLQYVGSLIQNVHTDPRICQSGFAPVIPIDEKEYFDEENI